MSREAAASESTRYVDSRGLAGYLRRSIEQSDRSVIGVTGVRGTGKSALLEHVLATLNPHHFVLLVTSPIRHDPGIGFLSTVCRAVCRRVLDDMHRVLYGLQTDGDRARSEIARRVGISTLVVLVLALATLFLEQQRTLRDFAARYQPAESARQPEVLVSYSAGSPGSIQETAPDANFCTQRRAAEHEMVRDLVAQIEAIEKTPATLYRQYSLLPKKEIIPLPQDDPLFLLAPDYGAGQQLTATSQGPREVERSRIYASLIARECFGYLTQRLLDRHLQFMLAFLFPKEHGEWGHALLSTDLLELLGEGRPAPLLDVPHLHDFATLLRTYDFMLEGETVRSTARDGFPAVEARIRGASIPISLVVALLAAMVLLVVVSIEFVWPSVSALLRLLMNWRYAALYREAWDFLELLQYSERRDSSGSLAWRGFSWKRSRSLAARDLTLPGLTARYADFVKSARRCYNGKMVVAIDEVDKIHDLETVKALFSEIKGALFSAGTFYLISISSDATRSFRQRLAAGRDIFESTFDDVIETGQMGVDTAAAMIQRLPGGGGGARIPVPCYRALTLMGGGIPREILRYLEKLSRSLDEPEEATPGLVAATLLRAEVGEWSDHLAELPLAGGEVIVLRKEARSALAALDSAAPDQAACRAVWSRLETCLALLDPDDLRVKGASSPVSEKGDTAEPERRYHLAENAVKGCLRLALMSTVCQLICSGHQWSDEDEDGVLEAHRALADKPALAEELLRELRERVDGSNFREVAFPTPLTEGPPA
jgi:hypothetical protein